MSNEPALLEKARHTLLAARSALPTAQEVDELEALAGEARVRGYLLPDEEAAIRFLVNRYLHVRSSLHGTIRSLRPLVPRFRKPTDQESVQAFLCAWLAGCMLMRSARYMIVHYSEDPVLWKALNQADPAEAIPAGIFDQIRRSSSHPRILLRYFQAMRYAEALRPELQELKQQKTWDPLVSALEEEIPFQETQKRIHASSYASTQLHRWKRKPAKTYHQVMFGLFEASGRAIAEMRNPLHRKRVRRGVRHQLETLLQAGDILITRHDDALSNVFLPGFWPHSAFVIGTEEEREHLQIQMREGQPERSKAPIRILEAKKDGVRFRALRETLAVDAFLVLRPQYSSDEARKKAVERALVHEGKLYDFEFDFTRSDRLVCTEVVYRSLEGHDGFHFELQRKAGRITLPAESLLKQALDSSRIDVIAAAGLQGNLLHQGARAREMVDRTLENHIPV